MKYTAVVSALLLANVDAFAPGQSSPRTTVACDALADKIFGMDLFAPKADQNNYGARGNKNLKVGEITDGSYVPNGLTKEQYAKIRAGEQAKKAANYEKNVKKAGVFEDFTDWYAKRGTELGQDWKQKVTLGHQMVKTKYDWSGTADAKKFESTTNTNVFAAKKAAPKKAAAKKAAAPTKKFGLF
uniref:Uncharacterized protein n=1 Tax=Entomoneis paludosa TaxID=265537 RepID=A0A7S2YM18_9STRA